MNNWSRVLHYFRPEWLRIVAAVGLMLLAIGANLLKPWPVALVIDSLLGGAPLPRWAPENVSTAALLALAAGAIFLLHCAQGAFSAGQNYLSIAAGLRGLARLRQQLFEWMQQLSPLFFQKASQGDLIYRATWDTYSLQTIFQHGVFKFLNSFGTLLFMVVIMWQVNAKLTLVTLAIFPPLLMCMYFFGRKMNRQSLAAHQADSQLASRVQQNIHALPLIQSYTAEQRESARFAEKVEDSLLKRLHQHRSELLYWFAIACIFGGATSMLVWMGAREIFAQRLSIGELVIFLSYLGQLYDPLNQLTHVGATIADANAGLQRVSEVLDAKEIVPASSGGLPFPVNPQGRPGVEVRMENISFSYVPGQPVLSGISLRVEPGEVIGIVGPSGAGKTTLLNLLTRFYQPDSGRILVNGSPLEDIRVEELRKKVAFVFQESFLLQGTLAENIAYGAPEADPSRIESAARQAGAHEFIMRLPQGYQTLVGESGARLSVGEKQRISIARAFLKDAPLLLLDEPTSSLDVENERAVVESLKLLMQNRTTLIAAHKLSTLKYVHKILVLEQGTIREFGSPDQLQQSGGYYARMRELE